MFTEKEFEEAYHPIWILSDVKSELIADATELYALFKAFQEKGLEMDASNMEEDVASKVSMLIQSDIITSYTMLGYPEEFNRVDFKHFELLCYAILASKSKVLLYSEYVNYCTSASYERLRGMNVGLFGTFKRIADVEPARLSFYSVLKDIESSQCDRYIRAIRKITQQLSESRRDLSREARLWLKRMLYTPESLARVHHNEYFIKADERYVDNVSDAFFSMIDKTSDELVSFLRDELYLNNSLQHYLTTRTYFSSLIPSEDKFKMFVRVFFNKDICKIYNKLNHSINVDTLEGKLLLAVIIKGLNKEFDYEIFNQYCDFENSEKEYFEERESAIDLLKTYYDFNIQTDTDDFLVKYYLDKVDPELSKKYMVLLYRVSSIVAKADGRITEDEAAWLSQLVSATGIDEREEKPEEEATDNPIGELNSLIGLESVKKDVTSLSNFIKMKQMREAKGLKAPSISYHCVFTGNPGTGKTTVARILASIFKELGILERGHLVETDRSGLVAEYVGQTAVKTNKIIDSALDGVLFIDEAYTLVGGQNDYGMEAIATLLKRMEDDRDRLIVILAGYPNEMEDFINSNPGLRSRFNRYIFFPDYSSTELLDIFHLNVTKNEYVITTDADDYLKKKLDHVVQNKRKDFGNARYVRNYFESAIEHQANRLASDVNLTPEKLSELTIEDIDI